MHGTLNPDPESVEFLAIDELGVNKDGKSCLIIRLKNCTGNIIDLTYTSKQASKKEVAKGTIVRSVDFTFKNQRSRTIAQAIDMVIRQRTISSGYFDD